MAFLVIWESAGGSRRSAPDRKEHPHSADTDKKSLLILFMPRSCSGTGSASRQHLRTTAVWRRSCRFFRSRALPLSSLALRYALSRSGTLAEQFTYTVKIIDNHELITSDILGRRAASLVPGPVTDIPGLRYRVLKLDLDALPAATISLFRFYASPVRRRFSWSIFQSGAGSTSNGQNN